MTIHNNVCPHPIGSPRLVQVNPEKVYGEYSHFSVDLQQDKTFKETKYTKVFLFKQF
jgi:hypothetical protein